MKNTMWIMLIGALFAGCAGAINMLNPDARLVRIVTSEPPLTCEYLGEVYGYQENTSSFNESLLMEGAINDTKNKANELGGNTIFFLSNQNKLTINTRGNNIILDNDIKKTQEISIVALVYKCK